MVRLNMEKFNKFMEKDHSLYIIDPEKAKELKKYLYDELLLDFHNDHILEWNDDYFLYFAYKMMNVKYKMRISIYAESHKDRSSENLAKNLVTIRTCTFPAYNGTFRIRVDGIHMRTNNVDLLRLIKSRKSVFYTQSIVARHIKKENTKELA